MPSSFVFESDSSLRRALSQLFVSPDDESNMQSVPSTPGGPRQLSIESLTLQKLVEALQRRTLQISNSMDELALDRPRVHICIRGMGDDFCGWPQCNTLFRINHQGDKDRAIQVHDQHHLDITPRSLSVFVPTPIRIVDRARISTAIQVATEQGRLDKLNIPANTSLAISFWDHSIPCRHCTNLGNIDAPPMLTHLCEHPRVTRVVTQAPMQTPTVITSPQPSIVTTIVEEPRRPPPPQERVEIRRAPSMPTFPQTVEMPALQHQQIVVHTEPKTKFDYEIAAAVWEQLKHAHFNGDEARLNVKRATLRRILGSN